MTYAIAIAIYCVLVAIAALHFYWAAGGVWPRRDRMWLARTVVGRTGIAQMPSSRLTLAVSLAIFAIAHLPLMAAGMIWSPLPPALQALAMWAMAAVFFLRGIAGYTPAWRSAFRAQPFALYDQRYYSPLCLAIGTGLALLIAIAGN